MTVRKVRILEWRASNGGAISVEKEEKRINQVDKRIAHQKDEGGEVYSCAITWTCSVS
jgi:hypothetical protein